jgi:hypothetical protein
MRKNEKEERGGLVAGGREGRRREAAVQRQPTHQLAAGQGEAAM